MWRENTDDLDPPALKKQRLPYNMPIAMELTPPNRIAQHYAVSTGWQL